MSAFDGEACDAPGIEHYARVAQPDRLKGFIMARDIPLPHPGEILKEEFFHPMGLSVYAVSKAIGTSRSRLNEICQGKHGITANIALRLGRYFGMDPQFFMNLQSKCDLERAKEDLADTLAKIEPRQTRAA